MSEVTTLRTTRGTLEEMAPPRRSGKGLGPRTAPRIALYVVLCIGAVLMLAPFVWMILTSVRAPNGIGHFSWLPRDIHWGNYTAALRAAPFGRYFLNSLIIAVGQTTITLIFATAAGYSLARAPIRGRRVLFGATVALIMVPAYIILVPEFLVVKMIPFFGGNDILGQGGTGWLNSWWALLVPGAISPFYIFLARQFFVGLPGELAEAARVDGLSEYGIFFRIMTPLIRPAIVTIGVLQVQAAWNNFLWPLLVTTNDRLRPIQLGLAVFSSNPDSVQWTYLMAGATIATVPMVVLFLVAQRSFIEGMASAGVKG